LERSRASAEHHQPSSGRSAANDYSLKRRRRRRRRRWHRSLRPHPHHRRGRGGGCWRSAVRPVAAIDEAGRHRTRPRRSRPIRWSRRRRTSRGTVVRNPVPPIDMPPRSTHRPPRHPTRARRLRGSSSRPRARRRRVSSRRRRRRAGGAIPTSPATDATGPPTTRRSTPSWRRRPAIRARRARRPHPPPPTPPSRGAAPSRR